MIFSCVKSQQNLPRFPTQEHKILPSNVSLLEGSWTQVDHNPWINKLRHYCSTKNGPQSEYRQPCDFLIVPKLVLSKTTNIVSHLQHTLIHSLFSAVHHHHICKPNSANITDRALYSYKKHTFILHVLPLRDNKNETRKNKVQYKHHIQYNNSGFHNATLILLKSQFRKHHNIWTLHLVGNIQGCRGYGDSHGYWYGMGMETVMNPHVICGILWGFWMDVRLSGNTLNMQ